MVYDASGRDRRGLWPGLAPAWSAGAQLYRSLGRIDRWHGARSWTEALRWIARVERARPIDEVQLWMHGRWGRALLGPEVLDVSALAPSSPFHRSLEELRERTHAGTLIWFRTCETFGADAGHAFAQRVADFFGCRAAGHTHIIGTWQSGLHSIGPGETPRWAASEGLREGTPARPARALGSSPLRDRTIHCLRGRIPDGW